MKQPNEKAKIYEPIYKVVQAVLYIGTACTGIATLVLLFMEKDIAYLMSQIELTLLFALLLLWQSDILIRKKLYKSDSAGKHDRSYTGAVCATFASGALSVVSFAIMSFCDFSGALALAVDIIVLVSLLTTATALAVEYSFYRKIKAEEAEMKKVNDWGEEENKESDETNER